MGKREMSTFSKKKIWGFRIAALLCSFLCVGVIEIGLRLSGLIPPDDPLMFHATTYLHTFSPFIETSDGQLVIKPDWIKKDEIIRVKKGTRKGRVFLNPGFRPVQFTKVKLPNTLRLFVLGGSTSFGLWVGAENAFAAVIQKSLEAMLPERRIEVINLGCPGMESTQVKILFETVSRLDPDCILIYSGHNEMLAGEDTQDRRLRKSDVFRLKLIRASRIAGWINFGFSQYIRKKDYEIVDEEIAAIEAGRILGQEPQIQDGQYRLPSAQYLQQVREKYFSNIFSIALDAKRAGIPTIFILPIPNLLFPPNPSAHADTFDQHELFLNTLNHSLTLYKNEQFQESLAYVDKALALSPDYAMAWFARGKVLLELERQEEAFVAFENALSLDVDARRITPRLQQAMIEAVERAEGQWIDLRSVFFQELNVKAAKALFVDHCHPSERGHQLIAEYTLPHIIKVISE